MALNLQAGSVFLKQSSERKWMGEGAEWSIASDQWWFFLIACENRLAKFKHLVPKPYTIHIKLRFLWLNLSRWFQHVSEVENQCSKPVYMYILYHCWQICLRNSSHSHIVMLTGILCIHFVSLFKIIAVSMVELSTIKGNQRLVEMFW